MKSCEIFQVEKGDVITVTGGGGKTSLIFKLADELKSLGNVLVTTTTKLFIPEPSQYERIFLAGNIEASFIGHNSNVDIFGSKIEKDRDKFFGVSEDELRKFLDESNKKYDFVLIEGDGSRRKPIKFWAEHEPVIPSFTTKIIGVANINALGKNICDVVHRGEFFCKKFGCNIQDDIFDENFMCKHLTNKDFFGEYFASKKIKRYIFLNGIESLERFSASMKIGKNLEQENFRLILGSIQREEFYQYKNIAAIIMASGFSKRFASSEKNSENFEENNKNKLLEKFEGETFIEKILDKVDRIEFAEKILVTRKEVLEKLIEKNIESKNFQEKIKSFKIIENKNAVKGQSESIKLGVLATENFEQEKKIHEKNIEPKDERDYMFFPSDQIFLTREIILKIIFEHMKNGGKNISRPNVRGENFSPVIFPHKFRDELLNLSGDNGGKIILQNQDQEKKIHEIYFYDEKYFKDIDTRAELDYFLERGSQVNEKNQEQKISRIKTVAIRSGGDLASGVINRLAQAGFAVIVLEIERPTFVRRTVSYGSVLYHPQKDFELEGLRSVCVDMKNSYEIIVKNMLGIIADKKIPVLVDPDMKLLEKFLKDYELNKNLDFVVLVDAILAKKNLGTKKGLVKTTIGLGPGFSAGDDVDFVIETKRGHNLGRVIKKGEAAPNTGIPGEIGGVGLDRVVYSPVAGKIEIIKDIGTIVNQGEIIANIITPRSKVGVGATIDGLLRGMLNDGLEIPAKFKMADIDPRVSEQENCFTISDKARAIAGGVLEVVTRAVMEDEAKKNER
ncbi:MAG: selenium-dependent molybdenum cofactor biosynthesis protein YqeB [Fusobacteriaceae bacterium]